MVISNFVFVIMKINELVVHLFNVLIGKRRILFARRGIRSAIRLVMRVKVKSCQDGMVVPLRKVIVFGTWMIDGVIFIFSTLRDQLHMEESLWWTRYHLLPSSCHSLEDYQNFYSFFVTLASVSHLWKFAFWLQICTGS